MSSDEDDIIEQRTKAALAAIKEAYGTEEDEYGSTLFVSHHLKEIDKSYWQEHFGSESPEPAKVLDGLVLVSDFEDEEDLENLDFSLPGDVTNYLICVSFDEDGEVEEISMES